MAIFSKDFFNSLTSEVTNTLNDPQLKQKILTKALSKIKDPDHLLDYGSFYDYEIHHNLSPDNFDLHEFDLKISTCIKLETLFDCFNIKSEERRLISPDTLVEIPLQIAIDIPNNIRVYVLENEIKVEDLKI